MTIEIKVPNPGESITQVQIASWLVKNGDYIEKNTEIAEIESDKATLAISAPESGIITFKSNQGDTVAVGQVIATMDSTSEKPKQTNLPQETRQETDNPIQVDNIRISPLAKHIIVEHNLDTATLANKFQAKRIGKHDVEEFLSERTVEKPLKLSQEGTTRVKMSPLRQKLAERLVAVKRNTAMLTTFNEVDMTEVMAFKQKFNAAFKSKTGYSLGFVSFFAKASAMAMNDFPVVNAMIDADDIVYHEFVHINIAVSTPKGLITPVIRNIHALSVPEIEIRIKELGAKAAKNRVSVDDLQAGTFTITNGGVFGSMMSTPLLNPPQAAILGMHTILQRPMAIDGKVVILPMMYIALSYDHRLIDGRESVGFVMQVKKLLEHPIENGLTNYEEFEAFLSEKPV
ncbi:MAG: 2-oxoglutarate dehydrogenase complex dihydrolipoyllysine-residue succinyltransferase [Bacteroidota bacterium]